MASTHDLCNAGPTFPFSGQKTAKKKGLSLAMAKKLVQAVLPIRSMTRKGALEIVKYTLKRNHTAYQSHRKKQVAIAMKFGVQVSL
jgi:hypothetical protein